MNKFDDYIKAVMDGAKTLAYDNFSDLIGEADQDTKDFIDTIKGDLIRWSGMLVEKKISEQDFRDLVEAKKDLAKIQALTQAGLALTRCERFRSSLINLLIDKAFEIFPV
ncbi:MAG TPA: hypothetical protein PKH14_04470 [Syntrophorhabdus sp.]|nr:hypothetical protein [Syntrophorhabdus sp.]